jgi:hypothetical protein
MNYNLNIMVNILIKQKLKINTIYYLKKINN